MQEIILVYFANAVQTIKIIMLRTQWYISERAFLPRFILSGMAIGFVYDQSIYILIFFSLSITHSFFFIHQRMERMITVKVK